MYPTLGISAELLSVTCEGIVIMKSMSRRNFLQLLTVVTGVGAAGVITGATALDMKSLTTSQAFADDSLSKPHARGARVAKFALISDLHLADFETQYVENTQNALYDLAQLPKPERPDFYVINGDITDQGLESEYEIMWNAAASAGISSSDIYLTMGNHEQSTDGGTYAQLRELFMQQAQTDEVYFDFTAGGLHFIVLGPDMDPTNDWVNFRMSKTQLLWLDDLLTQDEAAGVKSYVLCHEPLHNTVRDTRQGQWGYTNSIENDSALAQVIDAHRNVIFMSGHTHAYPDVQSSTTNGNLFIASGSVAYCFPKGSDDTNDKEAVMSYGLVVTVFENAIQIQVRDFLNNTWVEDNTYALPQ